MSRLQTITFLTDSGGTQQLTVQDYTETDAVEFFNEEYDEAINGSLRSNLRDYRKSFSVSYRLSGQPDVFRSICNNIASDVNAGNNWVYFGLDVNNLFRVIVTDDFAHRVEYANQHGLFVPRINMKAYNLGLNISLEYEDWRFVDEAVTESRNYGLITASVTQSIDYGTI